MEVHYWKIRGRAAPIRLALTVAGMEYTNHYLMTKEEWAKELEASKHPLLNLPYVKLPCGGVVSQSMTILRFLGREFHLYGGSGKEQRRVDEVLDTLQDYKQEYVTVSYCPKDEFESTARSFEAESIPYYFGGIERLVLQWGTPRYTCGETLTIADLFLFCELDAYAIFKGMPAEDALRPYPNLARIYAAVKAHPKVAPYLASDDAQLTCNGPSATWSARP